MRRTLSPAEREYPRHAMRQRCATLARSCRRTTGAQLVIVLSSQMHGRTGGRDPPGPTDPGVTAREPGVDEDDGGAHLQARVRDNRARRHHSDSKQRGMLSCEWLCMQGEEGGLSGPTRLAGLDCHLLRILHALPYAHAISRSGSAPQTEQQQRAQSSSPDWNLNPPPLISDARLRVWSADDAHAVARAHEGAVVEGGYGEGDAVPAGLEESLLNGPPGAREENEMRGARTGKDACQGWGAGRWMPRSACSLAAPS